MSVIMNNDNTTLKQNGKRKRVKDPKYNDHQADMMSPEEIFAQGVERKRKVIQKKTDMMSPEEIFAQGVERKRKVIQKKTDMMSPEEIFAQGIERKRKVIQKKTDTNYFATTADNSKSLYENIEKELSKRQLKILKAGIAQNKEMELHKMQAKKKAYKYIRTWKHHRSDWKFKKLKQIWLMDNLLQKQLISDKLFPVVLEYFKNSKGRAREVLIQKAMEVIRKAEAEDDEQFKAMIMKSTPYERSRKLLQILPHDKEL